MCVGCPCIGAVENLSDMVAKGICWLVQAYPYQGVTNFCKKNITDKVRFKEVRCTLLTHNPV